MSQPIDWGMMHRPNQLLRAIRRARLREMVGRVADAWLIAALLSTAGSILMLTRDAPRFLTLPEWGFVLTGLTLVLGLWRVLTHAFDAFSVASRLDGMNPTHDVLATAYSVRESEDAWSRSLVAQADRASETLVYPKMLGQYSARAHLAALAVAAATAICTVVFASPFRTGLPGDRDAVAIGPTLDPVEVTRIGTAIRRPGEATSQTPQADISEPANAAGQTGSDNEPNESGANASGAGRADSGADTALGSDDSPDRTGTPIGQTAAQGSGGAGDGASGLSSGSGTSDTPGRIAASPWLNEGWAASREAAIDSIASKDMPQHRRALVRAYFDR